MMISSGTAKPIRTASHGNALQLIIDDRFQPSRSKASSPCITAHEVNAAIDGCRDARAKIEFWPSIGTPALRWA